MRAGAGGTIGTPKRFSTCAARVQLQTPALRNEASWNVLEAHPWVTVHAEMFEKASKRTEGPW